MTRTCTAGMASPHTALSAHAGRVGAVVGHTGTRPRGDFGTLRRADFAQWGKLIRDADIKQ